jgi:hypothetical protein
MLQNCEFETLKLVTEQDDELCEVVITAPPGTAGAA